MIKVRNGEVWLANLDPQMGTEAGKTRPVIVVQTDLLNEVHPSTIICPITTKVEPKAEILRVHLKKKEAGLKSPSDILIDQVRAIDNRRFMRKLGVITTEKKDKLQENLKIVLDLQ